ncbi:MAG TPA: hypothetical protein VGV38_09925, partial [Pyrinomonadaceae bacterium]|nr:hypothetical protein [Pyrinomonadaceae bacterium]
TNQNAYPSLTSDLGTISITRTGSGVVSVPSGISFTLTVTQTKPWTRSDKYKATIPTTLAPIVGSAVSDAYLQFDYVSLALYETRYLHTSLLSLPARSILLGPTTTNVLSATITAGPPRRLKINSVGYGPRGAKKYIAALYSRFRFELDPPAPIVIRGADPTTTGGTPAEMTFDLGSSNAKIYTGVDNVGVESPKASVAISLYDWNEGNEGIVKGSTVNDPELSILDLDTIPSPWPTGNTRLTPVPTSATMPESARTPTWLETADDTRAFLAEMEALARTTEVTTTAPNGRYFTSFSGYAGDDSPYDPKFTFVDGNCSLDGGAGLLIVTGNLNLTGNSDFKGVILVLGNGQVTRSGGGNGNIRGSWIVARFIRNPTTGQNRNFLAPSFQTSGGGNGEFEFDSQRVRDANNLMGGGLLGIVEY